MVKAEAKPTRCDTNQRAEQDIGAKVPVVHEAAGAHVYGCADGHKDEDEGVDWRRGVLIAYWDDVFVCVG
jgi:hypothetical protein